MKISHFMLTVSAVIFAWLTASYLRPVPTETYEQANLTTVTHDGTEMQKTLMTDLPVAENTFVVK